MRRIRKSMAAVILAAMLVVVIAFTGCANLKAVKTTAGTVTGPLTSEQTQAKVIKEAALQADRAVDAITAIEQAKRTVARTGKLKPQLELTVTLALQKANSSIVAFAKAAKEYSGNDPAKRLSIINLFKTALSSTNELGASGVVGIGPGVKSLLDTLFDATGKAQTLIDTLQ